MSVFNTYFKKGNGNIAKTISLAVGLTAGLLLIAKVHFESTFDTCFPDHDRVYSVFTNASKSGEEEEAYNFISGGIAPAMAVEIPEVEAATRYTYVFDSATRYEVEGIEGAMNVDIVFADSLWFDVFGIEVIAGNPREILAKPLSTMVSRSTAERFGGLDGIIGKTFRPEGYEWVFTIEGVYEDFPENSSFDAEAITSLAAYPEYSTLNWIGNDRYRAFAKLREGVDPESITPLLRQMQERHVDITELEEAGVDIYYNLHPIYEMHRDDTNVKRLNSMMLAIAALLIATAVLNYILIVLSTMMKRTKEIAVKKCYGSSALDITMTITRESLANLAIAIALGAALAFAFRQPIQDMLGVSYKALATPATFAILALVVLCVFLLTAAIPAWFFSRIPVSAAFRSGLEARRKWKSALLFVEITATAYVAIMLANISRQYHYMLTDDPGYDTENLLVYNGLYATDSQLETIAKELRRMPQVEAATLASTLPIFGQSGNNIYEPGNKQELFNVADLYTIADEYFATMGIDVIEGKEFSPSESNDLNVMVSRSFVDRMRKVLGWTTSPIGWELIITEHSHGDKYIFKVVGVFEDIRIGTARSTDRRPSVVFYNSPNTRASVPSYVLIRLADMNQDAAAAVNGTISQIVGNDNFIAEPFDNLALQYYVDDRNLRDSIMACCLIALAISLTGVAGYVADEVNRRRREIAVRKVNGATSSDILKQMSRRFSVIAIPALLLGAALAWYSTMQWLQNYSSRAPISILLIVLALALLLGLILFIVAFVARKAANENPVNALYQN